jgi:hypothetical protein
MEKGEETSNSIYFIHSRPPRLLVCSGDSRTFFTGDVNGDGEDLEVFISDKAVLYVENLINFRSVRFHLRGRSRVLIKNGNVDKLYISSRFGTTFNGSRLRAEKVLVNCSNGSSGVVEVCPQTDFFRVGNADIDHIKSFNSSLEQPIVQSALKHKAKHFLRRSAPRAGKKTLRAIVLTCGIILGTVITITELILWSVLAFPYYDTPSMRKKMRPFSKKFNYNRRLLF